MNSIPLHESVQLLYQKQRVLLLRIVRLMFALAGCLWIVNYAMNFTPEQHLGFIKNQYQLYLVLLTLWGYDYRRELGRMTSLLRVAAETGITASALTSESLLQANEMHRFDVLTKQRADGKWFAVVFTWLLLVLAVVQIIRQLVLVFANS